MRRIQGVLILTLLALTTLSFAGPTLYFDRLTREVDACWRVGSQVVYEVAGRRYELPATALRRIDGRCDDDATSISPPLSPEQDPLEAVLDRPSALPPTDAVLASGGLVLPTSSWVPQVTGCAGSPPGVSATVQRVIDGDTIVARLPDGHREVVRYIGMNTPELHHPTRGAEPGGLEARAQNAALLQGKQITLAFDVDTRDRYGRLLAYVYADGAFVNGDLVRRGYAATATYAPNVCHADEFRQLEREARSTNAGLWGTSPVTRQVMADSSHIDLLPRAEISPAVGVYSGQDGTVSSTGISAASTDSSNHGPVHVRGYTRKDGTSVAPYTRSAPGSGGGRRR